MSEYTLKNIKTWKDHDGGTAYQASLYRDGKRVGTVTEDGWGGELQVDFKDSKNRKAENDAFVEASLDWLEQNRGWWMGKLSDEYFSPVATFVEETVFRTLEIKRFRTKLRKRIAIRTPDMDRGVFMQLKQSPASFDTPNFRDRLMEYYGDDTVILNDLNDTDLFNTVLAEPAFLEA